MFYASKSRRKRSLNYCGILVLFLLIVAAGLVGCGGEQTTVTTLPALAITPSQTQIAITPSRAALPQDWQHRWLNGIPCRPPCWENVIPGQTTVSEATNILQNSGLISNIEIVPPIAKPQTGYLTWKWISDSTHNKTGYTPGGQALYHANTPGQLIYLITPDFGTFKLKEVIQAYGEPSHVIASASRNPDRPGYTYSEWIIWLSQGFALRQGGFNKITINEDMYLENLYFFASSIAGFKDAFTEELSSSLVPWEGFKSFEFYCRNSKGTGVEDCTKV